MGELAEWGRGTPHLCMAFLVMVSTFPTSGELPVHNIPATGFLLELNTILRGFPIKRPIFYLPEVDFSN